MSERTKLVRHPNAQMEWEDNPEKGNQLEINSDASLMRGLVLPPNDRRGMAPSGSINAHQLSQATGCHLSSQIICKREIPDINLC